MIRLFHLFAEGFPASFQYTIQVVIIAGGQAQVVGVSMGKTTYSTTINYTSSFQGGTQEGIVIVYMYSQADGSIATAAMQKVMLG